MRYPRTPGRCPICFFVCLLCLQEGGQNLYWIRERPDSSNWVRRGHEEWTEVTGKSDLMVTSLPDGSSRCIHTGLPVEATALQARAEGVFWSQLRPFPDSHRDVYYYRAAAGRILKLREDEPKWTRPPVYFAGRLYGFTTASRSETIRVESGYPVNRGYEIWSLISINPDGSDRRAVCSLRCYMAELMMHAGSFYCLEQDPVIPAHTQRQRLYRVHLDRGQPLEGVFTLPEMAVSGQGFDSDGYFYFTVEELHRNLWATLTDDNANAQMVLALYRTRLPR